MSKDIKIKKGLDIKLVGEAEQTIENAIISNFYSIRPEDFHSIIPKLVAKEGARVKAGETLFYNKDNETMKFVSPVSGEVTEVQRGPRRRIDAIKITADKEQTYVDHGKFDLASDAEKTKAHLLASGCWAFIKQRPYDVVAKADSTPKAIFISGYASAPLAANLDFTLAGKEAELQAAVTALSKLTDGGVHISIGSSKSPFVNLQNVITYNVSGPHPSGNVGTLINKVSPVNKGETVWTVNAQDLVIIGELLLTGKFNAERVIALAGSSVKKPRYFRTKIGSEIATMVYDNGVERDGNDRFISGNVLSGKQIKPDGNLDYYSNIITVIPEGNDYELFGWNKPVFDKVSNTRALTFLG
ncbi:Na(+)-translocating NADH-quinone reductase subunit A [Winogradskyella psychrotolerans RS-3]|uniref:Na(+)-translocating NADH-quinone reductase subunit A n=1 Tax=Winogradskyella psychrotolerans RS-3 TaxID=641526 RepID=S7VWT6_9FLAO|nr:Na(+)-translocating NADH-quinone reductase subunit A [Winogradskyella psychrotolerans RS-3]